MARNKIIRYNTIQDLPNIIQSRYVSSDPLKISETWDNNYFNNDKDIVLELGCGYGEYTNSLAEKYPEKNFIGIDIKGARIWQGAQTALGKKLQNVLFLRIQIDHLAHFFPQKSISQIWITFPDPHLTKSKTDGKRRLTSIRFLEIYRKILRNDGCIHLKTDNDILYQFTKESLLKSSANIIKQTEDLYNSQLSDDSVLVQTRYEKCYLEESKAIKYMMFSYN